MGQTDARNPWLGRWILILLHFANMRFHLRRVRTVVTRGSSPANQRDARPGIAASSFTWMV